MNLLRNHSTTTKKMNGKRASTWRLMLLSIGILGLLFNACKKEPEDENKPHPVSPPVSVAVYVLNQGSYSGNNASVTLFNPSDYVVTSDYFQTQNNRVLGDTGADMLIYGGKAYIVTNISSQLEIVDSKTFKSLKQISFIKDGVPQQPSAIAGYGDKVYIASYDGLVTVIDTLSLQIIKTIEVGLNPDAILATNNEIWVSNSGGLNFPDYDNTISVIDPDRLIETDRIEVGTNPYTMKADNYGDIYLITRGNYGDEKMRLRIINSATKKIKHTFEDFEAYNLTIKGDTAYVYHHDFMSGEGSKIMTINVKTEQIISQQFITDNTSIETVYSIAADPTKNNIYITDAKDYMSPGIVYCFGTDGKLKFKFNAGINPVAVRFLMN